jgi:hypothetical protein
MKISHDTIIFTSGRSQYVFGDGFGLGSDLQNVCYGSDGAIDWTNDPDYWNPDAARPEDMIEIADLMIARWQQFKCELEKMKP